MCQIFWATLHCANKLQTVLRCMVAETSCVISQIRISWSPIHPACINYKLSYNNLSPHSASWNLFSLHLHTVFQSTIFVIVLLCFVSLYFFNFEFVTVGVLVMIVFCSRRDLTWPDLAWLVCICVYSAKSVAFAAFTYLLSHWYFRIVHRNGWKGFCASFWVTVTLL